MADDATLFAWANQVEPGLYVAKEDRNIFKPKEEMMGHVEHVWMESPNGALGVLYEESTGAVIATVVKTDRCSIELWTIEGEFDGDQVFVSLEHAKDFLSEFYSW